METSIYILGGTQFNPMTNGLFPFTACQVVFHWGFPSGSVIEESAWVRSLDGEDLLERRHGFDPQMGKIFWRREWLPTLVFLPGKSFGQRSLVGYSPWDRRVGHDWATNKPFRFHSIELDVPQFVYPFTCWRTFVLYNLGAYVWCCYKHLCIEFCVNINVHFSKVNT